MFKFMFKWVKPACGVLYLGAIWWFAQGPL